MGYIYILTNPSFPDYVKIGYADDVEKRLAQLNRSECIPYAFRVYATYEVDARLTDMKVHSMIDQLNPDLRAIDNFNGKKRVREFYAISKEAAYTIFEAIAEISGSPEKLVKWNMTSEEAADESEAEIIRENARRKPFRFSECNIPFGSKLEYIEDKSIEVEVYDDRHILFDGEITSVSALAQKLKGFDHPVQGTLWFSYNGKVLDELRREMEE